MKVNVEVDCTPEEARTLMGLPDMAPVHDAMLTQLQDVMKSGVSPDIMISMLQSWSPMGDAGLKLWQGLLKQVTSAATK